MALNPVPQAGQTLNTTRPLILNNFTIYIDMQFGIDHVPFGPGTDNGKHRGIHLVFGAPTPPITSTEIGLWNNVVAGVPSLMIQAGMGATAVNMTTYTTSSVGGTGIEYTYTLPCGIIHKWKSYTRATAGGSVAFPVVFDVPFPNSCDNVQVTTLTPSGFTGGDFIMYCTSIIDKTSFQGYWRRYVASVGSQTPIFMYFAIGR